MLLGMHTALQLSVVLKATKKTTVLVRTFGLFTTYARGDPNKISAPTNPLITGPGAREYKSDRTKHEFPFATKRLPYSLYCLRSMERVVIIVVVLFACFGSSSHAASNPSPEPETQSVRKGDSTTQVKRGLQWPQFTGANPFDKGYPVPDNLLPRSNDAYGGEYEYDTSSGSGKGSVGKGKGGVPSPPSDDYYIPYVPGKGKGGISNGKGKGGTQNVYNDFVSPGAGKGAVGYPQPPGKGKGFPGKGNYYYATYPTVGKGNAGTGKGWVPPQQDDDYSYGAGKGKGSIVRCSIPYIGHGSIPDNMWLGT